LLRAPTLLTHIYPIAQEGCPRTSAMPEARSHDVKGNLRAYLELTVAMVLVGGSVVVGKLMAESLPVYLAGGLSSAIGAAILFPLSVGGMC
jgi:hypothetical protein